MSTMETTQHENVTEIDDSLAQLSPQSNKGFFSLPGEIRNIIYAYCATDKREVFDDRKPLDEECNDAFALSWTCRQARAEFMPIYMQGQSFLTALDRLPHFLKTYNPGPFITTEKQKLSLRLGSYENDSHEEEFVHILRLASESPGLRINHLPFQLTDISVAKALAAWNAMGNPDDVDDDQFVFKHYFFADRYTAFWDPRSDTEANALQRQTRAKFLEMDVKSVKVSPGECKKASGCRREVPWLTWDMHHPLIDHFKLKPHVGTPDLQNSDDLKVWLDERGWSHSRWDILLRFNNGPIFE